MNSRQIPTVENDNLHVYKHECFHVNPKERVQNTGELRQKYMQCFSYQTRAPHRMLSIFDGILLMKFRKYGGRAIRTFGSLITQQIAPKTRYRTGQGLMENSKPAKIEKTTTRSVALISLPLNKDCTLSPVVAMSPSVV